MGAHESERTREEAVCRPRGRADGRGGTGGPLKVRQFERGLGPCRRECALQVIGLQGLNEPEALQANCRCVQVVVLKLGRVL